MKFENLVEVRDFLNSISQEQLMDMSKEIDSCSNVEKKVKEFLRECGGKISIKGYWYIPAAVKVILDKKNICQNSITGEVYPKVAEKYNCTSFRVERAIRHFVQEIYKNGEAEIISQKLYCYPKKHIPTNSEFLYSIAEMIRNEKK